MCAVLSVARSTLGYESRLRQRDAPALAVMRELAGQYEPVVDAPGKYGGGEDVALDVLGAEVGKLLEFPRQVMSVEVESHARFREAY